MEGVGGVYFSLACRDFWERTCDGWLNWIDEEL